MSLGSRSVHFVFHLCSAIRFVCHLCSNIVYCVLLCDWLYIADMYFPSDVQCTSIIIIIISQGVCQRFSIAVYSCTISYFLCNGSPSYLRYKFKISLDNMYFLILNFDAP